jgi:predicted RNase H-like HicB family nuclease
MKLLEFTIERDDKSGAFTASCDDPKGGGITTQAYSLAELPDAINEAVRCHFLRTRCAQVIRYRLSDLW